MKPQLKLIVESLTIRETGPNAHAVTRNFEIFDILQVQFCETKSNLTLIGERLTFPQVVSAYGGE